MSDSNADKKKSIISRQLNRRKELIRALFQGSANKALSDRFRSRESERQVFVGSSTERTVFEKVDTVARPLISSVRTRRARFRNRPQKAKTVPLMKPKELKEPKEPKESKEPKDPKDSKEPKEPKVQKRSRRSRRSSRGRQRLSSREPNENHQNEIGTSERIVTKEPLEDFNMSEIMSQRDFSLALRVMAEIKKHHILEDCLGPDEAEEVRHFFESEMSCPSYHVMRLMHEALNKCWEKLMDRYAEFRFPNEILVFLTEREKLKLRLFDVMLVYPDFIPLSWGGRHIVEISEPTLLTMSMREPNSVMSATNIALPDQMSSRSVTEKTAAEEHQKRKSVYSPPPENMVRRKSKRDRKQKGDVAVELADQSKKRSAPPLSKEKGTVKGRSRRKKARPVQDVLSKEAGALKGVQQGSPLSKEASILKSIQESSVLKSIQQGSPLSKEASILKSVQEASVLKSIQQGSPLSKEASILKSAIQEIASPPKLDVKKLDVKKSKIVALDTNPIIKTQTSPLQKESALRMAGVAEGAIKLSRERFAEAEKMKPAQPRKERRVMKTAEDPIKTLEALTKSATAIPESLLQKSDQIQQALKERKRIKNVMKTAEDKILVVESPMKDQGHKKALLGAQEKVGLGEGRELVEVRADQNERSRSEAFVINATQDEGEAVIEGGTVGSNDAKEGKVPKKDTELDIANTQEAQEGEELAVGSDDTKKAKMLGKFTELDEAKTQEAQDDEVVVEPKDEAKKEQVEKKDAEVSAKPQDDEVAVELVKANVNFGERIPKEQFMEKTEEKQDENEDKENGNEDENDDDKE